MRAISLWQPWASLWLSPRKIHETRHWPTSHRGWLLVHAAKRLERGHEPELEHILVAEFGGGWAKTLPTGALLGIVEIVACLPTEDVNDNGDDQWCGNYEPGRFAWRRDRLRRFETPIPYRGAQGFFTVPDEALTAGGARPLAMPAQRQMELFR